MEINKLNLAVFISGQGSNLQALINACKTPGFPAQINIVISNNPDAKGLERATHEKIPAKTIDHKKYQTKSDFEQEIQNALDEYPVDIICLAGFMRLLSRNFVEHWKNSIINIHPSLLPAYKGLNTHERALNDGCTESGCTVHFVRPEMDDGPIIIQKAVKIIKSDTPDTLAQRILKQEHKTYPEAIRIISQKHNNLLLSNSECSS